METIAERAAKISAEEARRDMNAQLAKWEQEGFIKEGWSISLADDGFPCATFRVTGADRAHRTMRHFQFFAYALGFSDRRRAVMNRKPRVATTA